jgi:hypothetical protein
VILPRSVRHMLIVWLCPHPYPLPSLALNSDFCHWHSPLPLPNLSPPLPPSLPPPPLTSPLPSPNPLYLPSLPPPPSPVSLNCKALSPFALALKSSNYYWFQIQVFDKLPVTVVPAVPPPPPHTRTPSPSLQRTEPVLLPLSAFCCLFLLVKVVQVQRAGGTGASPPSLPPTHTHTCPPPHPPPLRSLRFNGPPALPLSDG